MLTNAAAKAASAQSRAYKLHDQGGLHLLVRPTGSKSWQMKYRVRGREKLLTLGQFPEVSVSRARILQAEAKEQLERGIDPSERTSSAGTFAELVQGWLDHQRGGWSEAHAVDVEGSLERDILPLLGDRAAGDIGSRELLELVRSIERRGAIATAQRVRQRLVEIFAFARAEGLVDDNPARDLGAATRSAPPPRPHPALTQIEDCRALLAECERSDARATTVMASRFLALTAVRLAAVRGMTWAEVDLEAALWKVPAERMKLAKAKKSDDRHDHLVPLSREALFILRGLGTRSTRGSPQLVFAGRTGSTPIGEGAIRQLYDRTSFAGRHVPHGWRASFSTILNEQLGESWRADIDRALAHAGMGKVEAAYNRSMQLDRRRELMERWGQLLSAIAR